MSSKFLARRIRALLRGETAWQRACRDTGKFRQDSALWFWGVEVVGAAVFGIAGGLIGEVLTPEIASPFWQNAYPTVGGGIGIVVGFVITFIGVFAWSLFRAPYKQRDEARQETRNLKRDLHKTNEFQKSRDLELVYDDVFYAVCKERLANGNEVHRIGVSNMGNSTIYGVEVRLAGYSTFVPALPALSLKPYTQADSTYAFDVNPSSDWRLDRCVNFVIYKPKERTLEFCFTGSQLNAITYRIIRGREYSVSLGISAKDARIDREWNAILSLGKHGLNIDLSEVEVLEL